MVSLTTANNNRKAGQFILQAKALLGNPYDGHTLKEVIEETEALTGRGIDRVYVEKGCRGHDAPSPSSGIANPTAIWTATSSSAASATRSTPS